MLCIIPGAFDELRMLYCTDGPIHSLVMTWPHTLADHCPVHAGELHMKDLKGWLFQHAHRHRTTQVPMNYLVKKTISAGYCSFRFIEQVGNTIKEIQNTITIHQRPRNSISLQRVSADSCLLAKVRMHPSAVQNWIIASRWIHMNWYTLASRQMSVLIL